MTADDFLKGVRIRRKESAAKERLGGGEESLDGGILNTGKDGAGHTVIPAVSRTTCHRDFNL